jgi:hypothetical protein
MTSLAGTRDELRGELGFRFGFERDPEGWDEYQEAAIESVVRNGLRRFYFQALAPGTRKTYEWSFLYQTYLFSTTEDRESYELPEDFGSPRGPLLFAEANFAYREARIVNEAMLREQRGRDLQAKGVPWLAAIRAKKVSGATEQRYELLIYPKPDGEYDLRLGYKVLEGMLTESAVHLPGGAAHFRTILYACLMEAGTLVDEDAELIRRTYDEALLGSINYDGRMDSGYLGINSDPSIYEPERYRVNPDAYTITIDGLSEAP